MAVIVVYLTDTENGLYTSVKIEIRNNNNDIQWIEYEVGAQTTGIIGGTIVGALIGAAIGGLQGGPVGAAIGMVAGLGLSLASSSANPYVVDHYTGEVYPLEPETTWHTPIIDTWQDAHGFQLYLLEGFYRTTTYNYQTYTRGFGYEYIQTTNPVDLSLLQDITIYGTKMSSVGGHGGSHWIYSYHFGDTEYELIVNTGNLGVNDNIILRLNIDVT